MAMRTTTPDELRSRTMRAVKSKDTKPEWTVRRLLHAVGYRYRLHGKALPGKPDLVFAGRRKVIFVHGCFWHGHDCARGARQPKTNAGYWSAKIARNRDRDRAHLAALRAQGWQVRFVWECEIKKPGLLAKLKRFLS
jgi:DNA mismatch endonuclease (patch repair protein)